MSKSMRLERERGVAYFTPISARSDGIFSVDRANASVLWWEDDTLCLPPPRLPVLPGVTVALVQERARREGIPVAHRERTVAGLDGREVWLVNALHGIRPVVQWSGRPLEAGEYRPVVDRTYPLEDVVEASGYVETEQKTGNVVLTLNGGPAR